jgi:SAM-dependent methyltransferase
MMNAPIIDCRSFEEYCLGHIQGATSIPANELFLRMHELAKRDIPIILCGNQDALTIARHFFLDREFTIIEEVLWSQHCIDTLTQEHKLEYGNQSQRLWQPSPLIAEFIEHIMPHHAIKPGTGLDIACGAGRDMTYLAMRGWQMCGIDQSIEALQRSQRLAQHSNVAINTLQLDLENTDFPLQSIASSFDLICVFRYLHRPLLTQLQHHLKPNGIIIYQTFMEGCEKISRPKNPRFLLKHGELASVFENFTIIKNSISYLDDGRPVSAFIAQKNT